MISLYSLIVKQSSFKSPSVIIPPIWQTILLSDGSLTRHLEILLGTPVELQIQTIANIQLRDYSERFICSKICYPQISRLVWLRAHNKGNIVYANSIWNTKILSEFITNERLPIGRLFIDLELDICKQIYQIEYVHSYELERKFQYVGPFWSRQYFLMHHGEILASIQEFFSPILGW